MARADATPQVPSSWTVGELKDLLSREYEGKPEVEEQKVIFAGKILQNEQVLSETIKSPLPRQWSSEEAGEAGDEAEDEDEDGVDAKLHLVVRSVMCTPTTSCSGSATTTPLRQDTGGARGPAPADAASSPSPSAGTTPAPATPATAATTPPAPQQSPQPARQQQWPAFGGGEGGVTPLPSSPFASPPFAPSSSTGPQGPADPSALMAAAYEAALRALATSSPSTAMGVSPNGGGIRSLEPQMPPPMPYPYYYQWPSPYGPMPMSPLGFWPPPPGFVAPSAMAPGVHPNATGGLYSPQHAYYEGATAAQAHAQAYRAAQEATSVTNAAPANATPAGEGRAQGQPNQANPNNQNNQNNQNPNPNPIWNYVNLQLTLKLFVLGVIINQDGSVGRLMLTGFVFLFIYMQQMGMFSANGTLVQKFCSWYASTFRRLDSARGAGPESPEVRPVNPLVRIFIEVQWFFIALVASLLPSLSPESFTIDQVRPHQD